MNQFSFKKKFRLLTLKQYQNVFKNSRIVKFQEIVILGHKNNLKYSRLGISISKKNIKKSYQRNYFKRIIREFFRINKNNLFFMDYVVIIKKQIFKSNINFSKKLKYLWLKYFFNKNYITSI